MTTTKPKALVFSTKLNRSGGTMTAGPALSIASRLVTPFMGMRTGFEILTTWLGRSKAIIHFEGSYFVSDEIKSELTSSWTDANTNDLSAYVRDYGSSSGGTAREPEVLLLEVPDGDEATRRMTLGLERHLTFAQAVKAALAVPSLRKSSAKPKHSAESHHKPEPGSATEHIKHELSAAAIDRAREAGERQSLEDAVNALLSEGSWS